jgi:hypothetical protein
LLFFSAKHPHPQLTLPHTKNRRHPCKAVDFLLAAAKIVTQQGRRRGQKILSAAAAKDLSVLGFS